MKATETILLLCTFLFAISCGDRAVSEETPQPEIKSVGKAEFVCKLSKPEGMGGGTQGFDIFGDYMVNCRNYGYGNTTKDSDIEGNRHRIVKFRLPKLDESDRNGMVILKKADLLENYTIEDYGFSFATIGQGLFVWKDRLYMPTGSGNDKNPARLYVWNLRTRKMDVVEELDYAGMGEPEDMSRWRDIFIISSSKGLYSISL